MHAIYFAYGRSGFIGSHVAEALLCRGDRLTIVDNLHDFYSPLWKRQNLQDIQRAGPFDFYDVDICNKSKIRDAVSRARPDMIVHLAARAGVRPSIEGPGAYVDVNINGTLNLLELCREFPSQTICLRLIELRLRRYEPRAVFRGSSRLEAHLTLCCHQLAGEILCYTYAHLFRFSVICLRFFTVYGPRQRPDLAIHKFTSLIEAGKPVPIFGDVRRKGLHVHR